MVLLQIVYFSKTLLDIVIKSGLERNPAKEVGERVTGSTSGWVVQPVGHEIYLNIMFHNFWYG